MAEMGALLAYGVKGGCEAAVHSARLYLDNLLEDHAILKLNFKNAVNSVRRDTMLEAVHDLAPAIFPFVHSAYSTPSSLFWGSKHIQSAEGVQQGDPLGPLLFCLSIHQFCSQMKSEFCVSCLDDVTIGGSVEDISHDLQLVVGMASQLGLHLSKEKSEIICRDSSTRDLIQSVLPGARVVEPSCATLFGMSYW